MFVAGSVSRGGGALLTERGGRDVLGLSRFCGLACLLRAFPVVVSLLCTVAPCQCCISCMLPPPVFWRVEWVGLAVLFLGVWSGLGRQFQG